MGLLVLVGCQWIGQFEDIHGGTHADGGTGGSGVETDGADGAGTGGRLHEPEASAGGTQAGCGEDGRIVVTSRGPALVQVAVADRCVWMDATEVTRAQYSAFLATAPGRGTGVCEYDLDHLPPVSCTGDAGSMADDLPVTCVDWCDAAAFCDWAGKRLCEGSYLLSTGAADRGEWHFGCSSDGASLYPYEGTYNALACNGRDNPVSGCGEGRCSLWPAGSSTTCVTRSGVEDLAGNAAEWTGECQSVIGPEDQCNTFGGDIDTANAGCGSKVSRSRSYSSPLLGFRCCATSPPEAVRD